MSWEMQDYRKWSFNPETLRWPLWSVPKEFFPHYCAQVLLIIPICFIFGGINLTSIFLLIWFDYYFYYRLKEFFKLPCHFIPFTCLTLTGLLLLVAIL